MEVVPICSLYHSLFRVRDFCAAACMKSDAVAIRSLCFATLSASCHVGIVVESVLLRSWKSGEHDMAG